MLKPDDSVVQFFPAEVSIGISGVEEIEQVNAIHKADAIVSFSGLKDSKIPRKFPFILKKDRIVLY
jgi:hypothetical protein